MNFYSVRELRTEYKTMWDSLQDGQEVVITNNGKPSALMIEIPDGAFDETVQAVRQAKAMMAFNQMREIAAKNGYVSDEEIESEISTSRKERQENRSA